MLAWIEAAIVTGYGLILTASGLLVQLDAVSEASNVPATQLA